MEIRELVAALEALVKSEDKTRWRKAVDLVAAAVVETFKVTPTEVAILVRTTDNLRLKFEYPAALSSGVNAFPLAATSTAGDVARSSRGLIENGFAQTKHLAFYERVKIKDAKASVIQKMMAAPIRADRLSFAVVQVSRKGETPADAGADFTPVDLAQLVEICDAVAPPLKALRPVIN